jgi:hypothetical protein
MYRIDDALYQPIYEFYSVSQSTFSRPIYETEKDWISKSTDPGIFGQPQMPPPGGASVYLDMCVSALKSRVLTKIGFMLPTPQ